MPRANTYSRLLEIFDRLADDLVDPAEPFYDADGTRWSMIAGGLARESAVPFGSEQQLAEIRAECRALAVSNEFAINGHENRISYVVGPGHAYRAAPKPGCSGPAGLAAEVQAVLDQFVRVNRWRRRQQEIIRRCDRDGEAFLRFFVDSGGMTHVRFIEPEQVATPRGSQYDASATFGIRTGAADVETVRGYCVDGAWIDAEWIQHRKANVDANVKRGLPLYYPVRKNLRRAERLLRNMSAVAEIQSAIAIIRKHASGTRGAIEHFVQSQADAARVDPGTGRTSYFRRYAPGTVLDAFAGTDYEFPAAAIDAGRYVIVLQAELRAIAARLVMPEFMLTSDASNASYASTMVAEGPAVRMFQRLQHELVDDDLQVMERVVDAAAAAGRLPREAAASVEISAVPPSLAVRDRLREAQADQILVRAGAMSAETMARRHGVEPQG